MPSRDIARLSGGPTVDVNAVYNPTAATREPMSTEAPSAPPSCTLDKDQEASFGTFVREITTSGSTVYIMLAGVTDTPLNPGVVFRCVTASLLIFSLQVFLPFALIVEKLNARLDAVGAGTPPSLESFNLAICPGGALVKQKIVSFVLIFYLSLSLISGVQQFSCLVFWADWFASTETKKHPRAKLFLLLFGTVAKFVSIIGIVMATFALFMDSPDLEDMLLNSVALAFVMDADSVLYKAISMASPGLSTRTVSAVSGWCDTAIPKSDVFQRHALNDQRGVVYRSLLWTYMPAFGDAETANVFRPNKLMRACSFFEFCASAIILFATISAGLCL